MLGPQGHWGAGQEVPFPATRCLSRPKPSCPIRPPENCHSVPATPQECTCRALSPLVISAITPLSCLSLHLPLSLPGSSSPCPAPPSHSSAQESQMFQLHTVPTGQSCRPGPPACQVPIAGLGAAHRYLSTSAVVCAMSKVVQKASNISQEATAATFPLNRNSGHSWPES